MTLSQKILKLPCPVLWFSLKPQVLFQRSLPRERPQEDFALRFHLEHSISACANIFQNDISPESGVRGIQIGPGQLVSAVILQNSFGLLYHQENETAIIHDLKHQGRLEVHFASRNLFCHRQATLKNLLRPYRFRRKYVIEDERNAWLDFILDGIGDTDQVVAEASGVKVVAHRLTHPFPRSKLGFFEPPNQGFP
jgi:hypothetical protein